MEAGVPASAALAPAMDEREAYAGAQSPLAALSHPSRSSTLGLCWCSSSGTVTCQRRSGVVALRRTDMRAPSPLALLDSAQEPEPIAAELLAVGGGREVANWESAMRQSMHSEPVAGWCWGYAACNNARGARTGRESWRRRRIEGTCHPMPPLRVRCRGAQYESWFHAHAAAVGLILPPPVASGPQPALQ